MESQPLVVLVNLLVLLIFVVMRQINKRVFQSILLLPLAKNQFKRIDEYEITNKKLSYVLFYFLTFLSIILTIQFYDLEINFPHQNKVVQSEQNFVQVIYLSLTISLLILVKTALEYLSLYILDVRDRFASYITHKFLLGNYCIILLTPLSLFTEYNDFNIAIPFNEAIISLFFIYTIGQLVYILKNNEISLKNLHYIFLYICTFEFGIYLIIYKSIIDWIN